MTLAMSTVMALMTLSATNPVADGGIERDEFADPWIGLGTTIGVATGVVGGGALGYLILLSDCRGGACPAVPPTLAPAFLAAAACVAVGGVGGGALGAVVNGDEAVVGVAPALLGTAAAAGVVLPMAILLLNAGATRQIEAQHFVVGMSVIAGASAIGGGLVAEWNAHPPL